MTDGRVHRLVEGPNVYLVDDGELTLIDGGRPTDAKAIRDGIRALAHAVVDVDRVLLTHYDRDRVGALASLGLDAPIHAGNPDATYAAGTATPPLANRKGFLQRLLGRGLERPDLAVLPVTDGETIGGFRAYRAPGHTPGHTVYVHEGVGVAFLGDCVRGTDGSLRPARALACADADRNRETIAALVERLPPFEVAAPGRGDPITEGGREALERAVPGS